MAIKSYEVAFHRYNFMHLTGIKANNAGVDSAIHFYEKCLTNRLTENDFDFAKDGSTVQKLDVLENMMGNQAFLLFSVLIQVVNKAESNFGIQADENI